ncbi:hypothetical protein ACFL4R_00115 [Nitrospirota bacterium]
MRLSLYILFIIFIINAGAGPAHAQVDMCESVQAHIQKAKSIGGDSRARLKITQIFEARKYLKKSISEPDLVRCVFMSGMDHKFIMAEAVKAGIPNQTVQVVYVKYNMSLPPEERAPVSLVAPIDTGGEKVEPVTAVANTLSLDVIAKDTTVEGGVSSGPGCNQISPWTWCAY